MLVNCKICKNKIEREIAYKVIINNKNNYYCNKDEYINHKKTRETKDSVYYCIYEIFGKKVTNTVLYKEIDSLAQVYTYYKILTYLNYNKSYLSTVMAKSFTSEYAQIRYFSAILKNSLTDFIVEPHTIDSKVAVDIVDSRYKVIPRKKTLSEYENEVGGES